MGKFYYEKLYIIVYVH